MTFNKQLGENTPEIKRRTKGNNYPTEIRDLVTEKRKARPRWHQTRHPQGKTELNNLALTAKKRNQRNEK